jgi:hypothetical protein
MTSLRVKRFPCGKECGGRNGSRPPVENGEGIGETGDFAREFAGRVKTVPDPGWTGETVPDPYGSVLTMSSVASWTSQSRGL